MIVPAHNEKDSIAATLQGLRSASADLDRLNCALSLYVVDDGWSCGTGELARSVGVDRLLRLKVNAGLGAAVRLGLRAARDDGFDIAVKFDADLQYDPRDLPAVLEPILNDEAHIVHGDRFARISCRMP